MRDASKPATKVGLHGQVKAVDPSLLESRRRDETENPSPRSTLSAGQLSPQTPQYVRAEAGSDEQIAVIVLGLTVEDRLEVGLLNLFFAQIR